MKILLIAGLLASMNSFADRQHELYAESLDYVQVEYVKAIQSKDSSWCFEVQLKHNDEGWNHYANGWQVTDLKGKLITARMIGRPHDNQQPFTRKQCNIKIKPLQSLVVVKAKCNEHGLGGKTIILDLNETEGEGYTVSHYKK